MEGRGTVDGYARVQKMRRLGMNIAPADFGPMDEWPENPVMAKIFARLSREQDERNASANADV